MLAQAARSAGAALFNHVEAIDLVREHGRTAGLVVRDVLADERVEIHATRVLLCAGAATPGFYERWALGPPPLLVRACNLLVDRPAHDMALAARGASGRMLTATPWDGYCLVGTFQTDAPVPPHAPAPSRGDVMRMLEEANSAFPSLELGPGDVRLLHGGLTPAVIRNGRAELMPESTVREHGGGLYSVIGVKFTTARLTAIDALARMGLDVGRHGAADQPRADPAPLPHGTAEGAAGDLASACRDAGVSLEPDVRDHLIDWYGTEAADVVRFSAAAARLQRLTPEAPLLEGELIYAVEQADAARLADVVLRRTHLGTTGHPGDEALGRAADIVAAHLSWSTERREAEIREVEARYGAGAAPDREAAAG